MAKLMKTKDDYDIQPLSMERWADFEKLFGAHGAYGGCWCMWWFEPGKEFERMKGEANRLAMHARVAGGEAPGILAYRHGEPVGWCAFGPREVYPRLLHSRVMKSIDDRPVWSVVCFYVARSERRRGLTTRLLEAVIAEVGRRGGKVVEGYPNYPKAGGNGDPFIYTGMISAFLRAGFIEVARPSERRAIVRYYIDGEPIESSGEV